MDHPLIDLITARIREAEAKGAFDDLPGAGKPLDRLHDPDAEILNRLTREAGAEHPFVALSREIAALRETLQDESDRTRRREIMAELSMLETRIAMVRRSGT
ncbi:DUF1992 domain-containing protein [Poseidonocella sedimentorum]|uniref:DnaJ homologue subfamily C member 28 conserved domain-containing protein n=1 Tax=Poseidonocella sedimentorum TaxID=871652 RepID=A0A1I6CTJ8_9RHOB|nr:DUF1992 domain-containing protein [Poseidonocella sedimentorum]SFQ96520.1 protein of unknown function [Poseidonocella sedimentorum]